MKYFLNYIFYYTWLNVSAQERCVMRPLNWIIDRILPEERKKIADEAYDYVVKNPVMGTNTIISYNTMLTSVTIIFIDLFMGLTNLFHMDFVALLRPFLGEVNGLHNYAIGGFSAVLLSILINEKLLGWHADAYVKYFKEFEKLENKKKGYIIAFLFHALPVLILVLLYLYFYKR